MLCFHCMKELDKPTTTCPYCGKPTAEKKPLHQLAAGTVLNNRYIVGNSLGEGGFGITYVGLDKTLEVKIAIKEYYPSGLVNRFQTYSNEVTVSQKSNSDTFEHGMKSFLNEAKSVAKFINERSIVDVRDYFTENNTAYIIMEFIDGETLMKHLYEKGRFDSGKLIDLMLPLMRSLEKMHAQNIIHRDISPDNIMITADGSLKLLDFGAARQYSVDGIKTMSVILRQGYAPYEQYSKRSKQGPWTDVYALCGTIYKCITGVTPPDSLSRIVKDDLKSPSELGIAIAPNQEKALMRGLAILPQYRIQNINELIDALSLKKADVKPVFVAAKKQAEIKHNAKAEPIDTDLTVAADPPEDYRRITPEKPIPKEQTPVKKEPVKNEPTPIKNEPVKMDPIKNEPVEKEPQKKRSKKAFIISGIAIALVAAIGIGIIFGLKPVLESKHRDSLAQTVSAGFNHTVGLKSDGTVVAKGDNNDGECDVSDWKDIVAVSAGANHTIGLKADGTVVTTGKFDIFLWENIVSVSDGGNHTIGLKTDGTVVASGNNGDGECDVSDWKDIVAVSTGNLHTIGIKSDGTVIATGYSNFGQCDVSVWKDIIAVNAGGFHTVGLKSDGTVVATGDNVYGQCNVSDWTDIVEISAGFYHTIGLKSDGTVVATGDNVDGECDVSGWKDIVEISAGDNYTIGLKSDGTVVATGKNNDGQCNVSDWKDIKLPASKK